MIRDVKTQLVWSFDDFEGVIGDDSFEEQFETWCKRVDAEFKKYAENRYECDFGTGKITIRGDTLKVNSRRKRFMKNPGSQFAFDEEKIIIESSQADAEAIMLDWY